MVLLVPKLSKCCFCISLRTGALVTGYVTLIISTFLISIACGSFYKLVKYVEENKNNPASGFTTEQIQSAGIRLYIAHTFFILVMLLYCAINLMLIVGVHWNNLRLVGHYLTTSMVMMVFEFILVVLSFVFVGPITALSLLTWGVILIFFIIVVRSAYLEMQDRGKPVVYITYDAPNVQLEEPLIKINVTTYSND